VPIHEVMVKAAWLYHVEGLTQAQIGERMSLTRRRVNELLADALDSGIVRISFSSSLAENVELESQLRERYGLAEASIAPTPENPDLMYGVMGRVAAGLLDRMIATLRPASLGLGWGSTLRETVRHMSRAPLADPRMTVCSMMGGLTRGAEINTFEIVHSFAEALDAQCHYFAAPIYADSAASRDLIAGQPVFRELLDEAAGVDLSFLSVGDVTGHSLQVRYGLPADTDVRTIVSAGGVGDLLGYYLDANGQPVDHPLNRQAISLDLSRYRGIAHRIVVSGGRHKRAILRAVLKAGLATAIVTDADTARWLLSGKEHV
jgi:DNA-binding transcriptional regulator LsrR (DeoR family)